MSDNPSATIIQSMETVTVVVGLCSVAGGLSILLTLGCFNSMLFRESANSGTANNDNESVSTSGNSVEPPKKRGHNVYVHMIGMLSLSETCAACAFAMGFPPTGPWCAFQGAMIQFFQRAKWIWNALIGFQLYRFMVHDQSGFELWQMHAIAWGLCVVLEVLPFTDNISYGSDDETVGLNVCYFKGQGDSHTVSWVICVYFIPLTVCVLAMVYYAYQLWLRFRYIANLPEQTNTTIQITKLVRTLILYPAAMLITTMPNMVLFLLSSIRPNYSSSIDTMYINGNICFAWSFTYGLWLCAIFFTNSQEAKRRWRALLFGVAYVDVDNRLVRSDQAWRQNTEEVGNIDKAMDNALDAGPVRSFGANRSFNSSNGGVSLPHRSGSTSSSANNSRTNSLHLPADVEKGGVGANNWSSAASSSQPVPMKHGSSSSLVTPCAAEHSSPVYTSSSAVYAAGATQHVIVIDDSGATDSPEISPLHNNV